MNYREAGAMTVPTVSTVPAASAELAAPETLPAVLTVMRLCRALERIGTGLTAQQYRMLKLAGAGGERSARLADRLAVTKPALTATADGLVAAGLAYRAAEPGDRRVVRLCLTPAGRAALDRADAAYAQWLEPVLAGTGDPRRVLDALAELDTVLDERRRARREAGCAAPGGGSPGGGSPGGGSPGGSPGGPPPNDASPKERQA